MQIPIETVETSAFEMEYFRFGQGSRTAVILPGLSVTSVMGSRESIAKQYAAWNSAFTTYLFDRRKDLPETYSVYDMARDTADAMRVLGLSDVCLFGASQGGMIALVLTIENPDLVGRLALGSTSAAMTFPEDKEPGTSENKETNASENMKTGASENKEPDDSEGSTLFETSPGGEKAGNFGSLTEWVRLAEEGDASALYLAFGKKLYPEVLFEKNKEVLRGLGNFVTKEDLRRFITIAGGTEGFDVRDRLAEITCPVLVIGSEDDRVIPPESSRELAAGLVHAASCELHMYDGCGHAAFDTAPDYQERLLRFFTA